MLSSSLTASSTGAVVLLSFLSLASLNAGAAVTAPPGTSTPKPVLDGSARLIERFDTKQMMRLVISLKPPHPEEEQKFLDDVQRKGSPIFHQFLTSEQWVARFSPSAQDEEAVVEWAKASGLNVTQRYPNRMLVAVEAPGGVVESALTIKLNKYALGTESFFSNDRDPQIPSQLAGIVQTVLGLNSRAVMRPHLKGMNSRPDPLVYVPGPEVALKGELHSNADRSKLPAWFKQSPVNAQAATAQNKPPAGAAAPVPGLTNGFLDPTDIFNSNAYNFHALQNQGHCCNPFHNAGGSPPETSIGIATAYELDFNDLAGFQAQYPYLAYNVTKYDIGGTPSCPSSSPGCNGETTLDTEWSVATANSFGSYLDAAHVYVYQGVDGGFGTFAKIYNQMLSDNHVRVVTNSWGCAEQDCARSGDMDTAHNLFNQMTGQGWTIVAASGDSGATASAGVVNGVNSCDTKDVVNFPANDPDVVAAGGTTLSVYSDGTYFSEVGWTGGTTTGSCASNNGGSGGGVSGYYSAPSYQTPLGYVNRAVPDLSLNASSGQNFYFQGSLQGVGGTSIVSPELAGFFAQENAYLMSIGVGCGAGYLSTCAPLGNPNYSIYYEGTNPFYAAHYPFYDITSGCNSNDVTAANGLGYYCATTGYDLVTGWGSANMLQLAWAINTYYTGDFSAPAVSFTGPATGVWYNTDQEVSWTVADTTAGYPINGVAGFTQAWDSDPGDAYRESTPGSGNSFYSGPQFPNATSGYLFVSWTGTQGCHTANVRTWDNAGTTKDSAFGPICYDTIAPFSSAGKLPGANGNGWNKTSVTVSFSSGDPGYGFGTGSGVSGFYSSVDNPFCGSFFLFTCVASGGPVAISAQGVHTVYYFAQDRAGNFQSRQALAVNIDETAPHTTATLTGTLSNGVYVTPVKVTLTATDNLSGVGSTTYTVDNGPAHAYAGPFMVSSLGNHVVLFFSTDRAGNTEKAGAVKFATKAITNTAVASSLNPAPLHSTVTFTATVSSAFGTPTGNVTFKDGVVTLGTAALFGGHATLHTTALAVGSHSISAVYAGVAPFPASTSPLLTEVVVKDATSTSLISSVNPSAHGQIVTFTAKVTGTGSGTPTGTVTFKSSSTTIGTGVLSSGKATFAISSLSIGSHFITAVYGGSTTYATSTSPVITQKVH